MLTVNMTYEVKNKIDETRTAKALGSGGYPVAATPYLVLTVENAAFLLAEKELPEEQSTVGTNITLDHLKSTPEGMSVTTKVTLCEIDRKKLSYTFEVYDECELVARGTHERFIVDTEKFLKKAQDKLN